MSRCGRGCSIPTSTSTAEWTRAQSSTRPWTPSPAEYPTRFARTTWPATTATATSSRCATSAGTPQELPELAELLPHITTPVTIINGRHDRVVPVANAEFLDERLPNSRVVLVDAGHFVWEEAPAEYAADHPRLDREPTARLTLVTSPPSVSGPCHHNTGRRGSSRQRASSSHTAASGGQPSCRS